LRYGKRLLQARDSSETGARASKLAPLNEKADGWVAPSGDVRYGLL